MSQSGGKATLTSLDDGKSFTVQYNPKEFNVSKALTWQESEEQGPAKNRVQFQKAAPMTASFDLIFDTTDHDGGNVQSEWINPLLKLTNADVQPSQGEAKELSKKRPAAFRFEWGGFSMDCVVEQISVQYLMFASDGTAVRARASVKLKEWIPIEFDGSTSGMRWDADRVELVEVTGGQSLSQVAEARGADWRQVAEDNGIDDPLADLTGMTLYIRS